MSEIKELIKKIVKFRDARDWKQFHNPKDVAIMLINESSEVLEHFRWIQKEELAEHIASNREEIEDEIADVLFCLLLLSHEMNVDLKSALKRKLVKNGKKRGLG